MAVAGPQHPVSVINMPDPDQIMDTRTPSPVNRPVDRPASDESGSDADSKPDLSSEVALLSTKLVNAINYNTNLDDSLQQCRHELEQVRARASSLEIENKTHEALLTSGALVKRDDVDETIANLRKELAAEKAARDAAEKAKKQTEGELENLTSALFEEANSMVAKARHDTEAVEKRNLQLKSQLKDTETLLHSQQEQLHDLKATMEKLQDSPRPIGHDPSMPSTPVTTSAAVFEAMQLSPNADTLADLPPEHPLYFSQLISPVLRNDTTAFTDFLDLLLLARRLGAHSRTPSSTGAQGSGLSTYATAAAATSSSPNLPGSFSFSNNSSPSSNFGSSPVSIPALKESKFYKRVLSEDIEPTLRLDLAPGLSFLSRRTVLGSLLSGTLAVEPYPQNKYYFACTLCGESRRTEPYVRRYMFRTSEEDNVSKPLCDYCVSRLRATCDFVGFLRMVRDGHWKCESEEDQKSAWEESVRLRERMFWSRLGGGVVPCLQMLPKNLDDVPSSAAGLKNLRPSLESIPERKTKLSQETTVAGEDATDEKAVSDEPAQPIDDAQVGTGSRAAALSTPEMPPTQTDFETPPPKNHLSDDEEEDASAAATQPATPFEDAPQQLETPSEAAAEADEQLKTELEAEVTPAQPEQDVAIVEEPASSPRHSLKPPGSESTEASPRNSLQAEHPPHVRKNSSVLDRVRAMEAGK